MIALLLKSLGASDWTRLLSLVSPDFFKVVPLPSLSNAVSKGLKLSKTLKQASSPHANKETVLKASSDLMNLRCELWQSESKHTLDSGDLALRIYFSTIFDHGTSLLDIGIQSFEHFRGASSATPQSDTRFDSKKLVWKPTAVGYPFEEDFLKSLQRIYSGFYSNNDSIFESGLSELNLLSCASAFKELFGHGDQTSVPFRMSDFVNNFHRVFTLCKKNNIALHQDFVALGVFLAFLYEHLEKLTLTTGKKGWNARQAFTSASQRNE